ASSPRQRREANPVFRRATCKRDARQRGSPPRDRRRCEGTDSSRQKEIDTCRLNGEHQGRNRSNGLLSASRESVLLNAEWQARRTGTRVSVVAQARKWRGCPICATIQDDSPPRPPCVPG